MKNKFGFILVKPQLGENIGACARSLKNFGFTKLHIVSPKQSWPNNKAKITSVGAYDIIKKAKIYSNTYDALNDFNLIISLSARKRDINKREYMLALHEAVGHVNHLYKTGMVYRDVRSDGAYIYELTNNN